MSGRAWGEPHSEACCPIRRSHKLQTADKQTTACRAQTSEKSKKLRKRALTEKQQRNIQHSSFCLFVREKLRISSSWFSLSLLCGLTEPPSPAGFCVGFKRMTSCSAETSLTNTQRYSDCCFHHVSSARLRSLLLLSSSDIITLGLSSPFSRSFISEENSTCCCNGHI